MKKSIAFILFFLLFIQNTQAQTVNTTQVEEHSFYNLFTSQGMIYVVVLVLTVILLGIFTYLFYIDKKVAKMEKQLKNHSLDQHKA